MTLMPLILASQEDSPIIFDLLQAFISRLKSLSILRPVVLNRMIGPLGNLLRLRSLRVILYDCIPTEDVLFFFALFLVFFKVVALSLKLSP